MFIAHGPSVKCELELGHHCPFGFSFSFSHDDLFLWREFTHVKRSGGSLFLFLFFNFICLLVVQANIVFSISSWDNIRKLP